MSNFLNQAFSAVSGTDFEEIPVKIEEFVTDIIGHPPLSEIQYDIVRASTQIFRKETLISLYGEDEGNRIYRWTKFEVICALGKGSGKDQMAKISCLYIVYQLLCLKSPQKYYKKDSSDYIDIMNIAINADQAQRVFFGPLVEMIRKTEWFNGKYDDRAKDVVFDKYIRLTSGHSEAESLEGYNVICVILDEISGFALESNTGNQKAKTASAIYKMHRASVKSRFPDVGKLILLSFPRFEGDFIMQRYQKVVQEIHTVHKKQTLKRDYDLPDGIEANEFEVEWTEDHILSYKKPRVFAVRAPTWEVNPIRTIHDFAEEFEEDLGDALTRFAANPTANTDDAYFKNHELIDETFAKTNGVDESGVFYNGFVPQAGKKYYMHVDLAQKHDRCVVAMAHVDQWKEVSIGSGLYQEFHPVVVIDAIRWWQPTKDKSVEFQDVIDYILSVRRRGFNIELVTFDRWNAVDTRNKLEDAGIETDSLSVGNDQYADFKVIMHDRRLVGPLIPELRTELKELQWIKGKVDHPRSGYKDLSDGSAGAIANAVAKTERKVTKTVEAGSEADFRKQIREQELVQTNPDNIIRPPKREVPGSLREYLTSLGA